MLEALTLWKRDAIDGIPEATRNMPSLKENPWEGFWSTT